MPTIVAEDLVLADDSIMCAIDLLPRAAPREVVAMLLQAVAPPRVEIQPPSWLWECMVRRRIASVIFWAGALVCANVSGLFVEQCSWP